ncbi:TMEM165/GDT1 family protein [Guggenheimella bovis]
MIQEFLQAFVMIFVAEMGDKSQLLAMAFATKYPLKKVILGLFLGIFCNHALAVLLGRALTKVIPLDILQGLAGVLFILFALWSLQGEGDEEEEEAKSSKHGVTITVALAFFLGELGDKTQLAAITLAAQTSYPILILSATVSAMMLTGLFGIFIGKKLGDKVPETLMNIIAGFIFYVFGVLKLKSLLSPSFFIPLFIVSAISFIVFLVIRLRKNKDTVFRKTAQHLKEHYEKLSKDMERICLRNEVCTHCLGAGCPVGYTKLLLKGEAKEPFKADKAFREKNYDQEKIQNELKELEELIHDHPEDEVFKSVKEQLDILKKGKGA